jgi:hypothetical protein
MFSDLQPVINKNPFFQQVNTRTQLIELRKLQARESSKVFENKLNLVERRTKLQSQESFSCFQGEESKKKRNFHKSLEVHMTYEKPAAFKQGIHQNLPKFSENLQVFAKRLKGVCIEQSRDSPLRNSNKRVSRSVNNLQNWSILNDSLDIVEFKEIKRNVKNQLINFNLRINDRKSSYFHNLNNKEAIKKKSLQEARAKKNMLIKNRVSSSFKSSSVLKKQAMMRTTGFMNLSL